MDLTITESEYMSSCTGADPHGGLGGLSPPYLPNTHGYPPKPLLDFWDEIMKRKRGEEEEEKSRKKKRVDMTPSIFLG